MRYRKSKPRHPGAPCTRDGRPVVILRVIDGLALIKFGGVLRSGVYYGEYDEAEGVVDDVVRISKKQAKELFGRKR